MRTDNSQTEGLATASLPDDAAQEWLRLAAELRDLYTKLAQDPAMKPNLEQTFSTPANNKNKVYFMWDFVGRTLVSVFHALCQGLPLMSLLHNLYLVPSDLQDMGERDNERMKDCIGRAMMSAIMITDTESGRLEMMTEMTYPDQRGKHPNFSDEVMEAAKGMLKEKEGEKGKKSKKNSGGGMRLSPD